MLDVNLSKSNEAFLGDKLKTLTAPKNRKETQPPKENI